ncbi:unnamed protein product [Phytophthora fragariaefolia]|uniref:Unnamed protein product n=1 Tax=Phytophthora fragariaefolia TaxID=1490495 RepID=A0A9W6XAP1_9STRA|nr:unnamed protein product [Phytophthora fragariaefolia]
MAFQARWRELKKTGWTSKRPTGLSVDFTYLKPGKTIKDVKGEDVFVGEEAPMHSPVRSHVIGHTQQTQPSPSVSTLRPDATPRPSIPQTPAVLQAFSPHDTTYSPGSDSGHSDSRFKGINRMFIFYGPIKAYLILYMPLYRVLDLAIRPRNLDSDFEETHESSDSSEDSEDEDQSETNAMHPGFEEESKEDSQVFDLSVEGWSNFIANDDPSKFAVLESDAENDDGDDDDQSDDVAEVESVELPVPPEMRFDDRLLSSLGGMENIASGAVPDKILNKMGGKWLV